MTPRFSRAFLARPAQDVAPDLLGAVIARRDGRSLLRARIVEVEAYGPDDPASHSFGGPTTRNRTMFGPAGHLYVYLSYGIHHCMNVVTGKEGEGSAVLIRAAQPIEGLERMSGLRGDGSTRDLCRGPGRLARALDVNLDLDGADLLEGELVWLEKGRPPEEVLATSRVGITRGEDRPWRFVDARSPWLSRPVPRVQAAPPP